MPVETAEYRPGLEGVVAAETRLSRVDGEAGELWIAGIPVEVLAPQASFEEVLCLLWDGELPAVERLESVRRELASRRRLPESTLSLLRRAAGSGVAPMDALVVGTASLGLEPQEGAPSDRGLALRLVAAFPTLVATFWRLRQGKEPVAPDPDLRHAANYLYMLTGEPPSVRRTRALETYLNTVVDHGMNASTFATRVIVSTGSDLVSAVTGGLGALKGPLHGGAPGPALETVFEIGSPDRAEPVLRERLSRGERLMGFGHRVYRVRDPRADVLARAARELYVGSDQQELYDLARAVEETAVRLLAEHKPGRRVQTNVEFYTALLLHGVGLDTELFTPTFALSRVAGWTAHAHEQLATGRLLRPRAAFVGEGPRPWKGLEDRA